jgi:hypothetical protein
MITLVKVAIATATALVTAIALAIVTALATRDPLGILALVTTKGFSIPS